ncbi:MAG TPA: ChbG/HpnK family deacetylase [Bryobacteraceae bacterium]|nr:ChbG/HpnK family deacetylase [Bryobacteraceae bacterium]
MARMLFFLACCGAVMAAQDTGEIRLIVQGDDMGAGHGVNVATIAAFKQGILRSTNLLAPGAWAPEAARLLADNPGLDVGVHLTLTSEWERVKWRPLTCAPSLVDENGYFFPMVFPRDGFPAGTSIQEARPNLEEAERELRAQIELTRRLVPRASYLWPHMGFDSLSKEMHAIVARLASEYKMPVPGPALGIRFLEPAYTQADTGEARAAKLAARLETLTPGTWLTVDHAATDTPEIQAFGHTGYENVAADRSAVLEAWTSAKVREVVNRRGIRLTGYGEILRRRQ